MSKIALIRAKSNILERIKAEMFDIVIVSEKPCWWLILTSSDFSDDIIVVNIPEDEHHYRNQVDINE